MKKQTAFLRIFSLVLLILVLLGTGSSASVLQSNDKVVSAAAPATSVQAQPVNHVLVIPSAEFRPDGNIPDAGFYWFGGGYWVGETSPSPCFMAPVYLPRIGTVYQVWATVYDNDVSQNIWLNLYRIDNYTGTVTTMAELSTSGASTALGSIYDITIQQGLVSYPQYSYYLGTCLNSASHRLYNVRVWYRDYETHLPMIRR
jgi:hypothetical protein